jgi:hypothetical protein
MVEVQKITVPGGYVFTLWLLSFLFVLRVSGQALVAFLGVSFLPPMSEWDSGLIPYRPHLAIQCLILLLQLKINLEISRGRGFFARAGPRVGRFLLWSSAIYFVSMALRYGITMARYPERRWLGGAIPIVFHFVLAGYLFALSRYHLGRR